MSERENDKTMVFGTAQPQVEGGATKAGTQGMAPRARLVCLDTSAILDPPAHLEITLANDREQILGRDESCSTRIKSRKLSREHARFFPGVGQWGVEDLGSTNGVRVNGEKVSSAWLGSGDEVRLGPIPFRYELERPDIAVSSQAEALPEAELEDDGEGEAERTMIVGSTAATAAVLEAVRVAEEEEEEAPPPPPKAKSQETKARAPREAPSEPRRAAKETREVKPAAAPVAPARRLGSEPGVDTGRLKWWGIVLVVLLAVGAGAFYYIPHYRQEQEIAALMVDGAKAVKLAVEETREKTNAQLLVARYEDELAHLNATSARMARLVERHPRHVALADMFATITFLEFERDFVRLFHNGELDLARRQIARVRGVLEKVREGLPEDALESDIEDVVISLELVNFAEILVRFREFTLKFPEARPDASSVPDRQELYALLDLKTVTARYRRTYNRPLSVTFTVFKIVVDDVDDRDIAVINAWKGFLKEQR